MQKIKTCIMAYVVDEKMPKTYFIELLTEKANMIKNHLQDRQSLLVICANIGPNMVTFILFDRNEEDTLRLHFTLWNPGDIDVQLHKQWQQVNFVLKQYCAHCQRINAKEYS